MLKTLLALTFLVPALAQAASSLDSDIKSLTKAVAEDYTPETEVGSYNVKTFSYKPLVKDLMDNIRGSTCKFSPAIGNKKVLTYITDFYIFKSNPTALALVKKMEKAGDIKASIGYYWPGESGDVENCSRESITFYFTNGKYLNVYFNGAE